MTSTGQLKGVISGFSKTGTDKVPELSADRCRADFVKWQKSVDKLLDILKHHEELEEMSAQWAKIVEHEALYHMCNLYINPSHIVFDLVPQTFGEVIQHCYEELGHPLVMGHSTWDVYLHLLDMLQINEEIPSVIEDVEEDLLLLQNQQDLPYHEEGNGTYYIGGVGGGLGLGDNHLCQLDNLALDDEPETTASIDEDVVGLDHDGLVIWEFSNESDNDTNVVDEW
ncbi:uncharacterized protein EDB93DRAFT_1257645 [Suillus bovinus]|uniref:uncharacterized protein n=1 Tax=Suillus bovinus TaxID=48563 RepID=UPI001B87301C|nr:uncharacterized protein EDB93DRAFT_1257645 [Suillus bovinus]KAG2126257.1 hypothetical protein EDB93DRAFT_1257645 [Suillus bovinus]